MRDKTNRRDFLKQTGLAGVGFWVAGGITLADDKSPNEKVNIACIGVGGKGSSDTDHAAKAGTLVAICDIDERHLDAKAKQYPGAKKFSGFRKIPEQIGQPIYAATLTTPDNTPPPA